MHDVKEDNDGLMCEERLFRLPSAICQRSMYKHFLKRFLDFFISLIALIVLSPFLIIIAIWLYIANSKGSSPLEGGVWGRIFFFQERPGKDAKIFKIIKFKSMTDERDADGNLLPGEQRITKIGRFVRAASLDELPQLLNVLKGDMSLIGPRPLVPRYLELYSREQMRRHEVCPGITGWAQVNGRNSISWTKKFEYDVWYVDHLSLWLDIKILWMTAMNVIRHKDIDSGGGKVGAVGFDGTN